MHYIVSRFLKGESTPRYLAASGEWLPALSMAVLLVGEKALTLALMFDGSVTPVAQ